MFRHPVACGFRLMYELYARPLNSILMAKREAHTWPRTHRFLVHSSAYTGCNTPEKHGRTFVGSQCSHRGGSYFRPAATPNRSGPDYIYRHRHQVRGGDNFDHHGKMGHDTTSAPRGGIRN